MNKFLTSVEISRDTADIISIQVLKAIANYNLETKVVGLSAYNTVTDGRHCTIPTKTSEVVKEGVKKTG
jgi:hypothetical protein